MQCGTATVVGLRTTTKRKGVVAGLGITDWQMRSLSGYPEGPRDTHTRPPSQTFSALTSNGTTRSQAYTPTHTHSYSYSNQFNTNSSSNPNLNSNSNPNFNNSNSNSNSGSSAHSHSHSHSYLNSNAMSRSPAKQHAGLPDEDVYLPPRRVDPASRPSSPAKQSYYHSRTPPGSPRIPAPSLQPNGNTSPARSPSPGYLAPASGSRPSTPSGSRVMGSARSDDSHTLLSPSAMSGGLAPSSATSHSSGPNFCSACGQPMTAQFVRALGTVFHLECFRCRVCSFFLLAF
jgi:hypothetical protein